MNKEWYQNAENEAWLSEKFPDLVPFAAQVAEIAEQTFNHGKEIGLKEGYDKGFIEGCDNGLLSF